jgi:oligopeptide/dipeptide ABC transporter ATP-binding protein
VALARALALNPRLLILDEPTSALDVSVQAQILNLLQRLQADHQLTYMVISHSLGVVQHISDRIGVLYLGELVELGPRGSVTAAPAHPYTQALFAATPVPDPRRRRSYVPLGGAVPSAANPPPGCRFHTRCPHVMEICRLERPALREVSAGHAAACHLIGKEHHGKGSTA